MPRNKRDVETGLVAKGFVQDDNDHHFFVYWTLDGRKTRARTKTSHTQKHKDIGDNLLSQMAQQCKLPKRQFLDLIDCPMDRGKYEAVLVEREEIPHTAPPKFDGKADTHSNAKPASQSDSAGSKV